MIAAYSKTFVFLLNFYACIKSRDVDPISETPSVNANL